MTSLAGLAGGLTIAGVLLLVGELTRHAPPPGTPVRHFPLPRPAHRWRVVLAITVAVAVLAVTRWPVAMIGAAAAVVFVPQIMSSGSARRQAAVLEGLEQWTRRLTDMLTASRGLEDAIEASAAHTPPAIAPAVRTLARRLSARTGTEAALRAFADDLNDPAADRIAVALIIATSRRGGAVSGVLSSLAGMLAADVRARREIEAERAQHRTTVRWLVGFVVAFTAFAAANRSYALPYGTVAGQVVLALVILLYAGGLAWLHRLGSARPAARFLGPSASRSGGAP